jgi:hypothetical protein
MGVVDRKQRLFENVFRLRRAQREAPGNRDILAVRSALEEELGETVSQRLAARLLGVTHPALSRWIKAGDLPLVPTPGGRREIPVAALLDLYEAVERERESGGRRRHLLEPSLTEARERASRLRPDELVPSEPGRPDGHTRADRRSLAYHRAVAERLDRAMVDEALHRVLKWRDEGKLDPRYAGQWETILSEPLPQIRRMLAANTDVARELRQTSPFAGMLSEPERRRILAEIG